MTPRSGTLVLAAALALAATRTTGAQTADADLSARIDRLVAMLDAEVWSARTDAEHALLDLGPDAMGPLEARLADPSLSPEQRTRILLVLKDLFFQSPRAAIGITFNTGVPGRGPMVTRTEPSFQCHSVLRSGDIITALDEVRFDQPGSGDESELLRAAILSHLPGEWVTLRLIRDGQPMDARVRLGYFSDLRGAPQPNPMHVLAGWSVRYQRLIASGPTQADPIASPLLPAGWADAAPAPRNRRDDEPPRVVAGGQPRGVPAAQWQGARAVPGADPLADARAAEIVRIRGEIQRLERLLAAYERERAAQVARATDPALTDGQRTAAARLAGEYERSALEIRQALQEYRAHLELLLRRED